MIVSVETIFHDVLLIVQIPHIFWGNLWGGKFNKNQLFLRILEPSFKTHSAFPVGRQSLVTSLFLSGKVGVEAAVTGVSTKQPSLPRRLARQTGFFSPGRSKHTLP